MTGKPNNLIRFWQELKRRKVVRVIPVYAAASFVLLELVDIIAEPFGLPDWTLKLVFVLLCIGFFIAIILSWVYDITPEGVQKTKSISKVTEQQKETGSKIIGWKIATYISVVIIIGLLIVNVIGSRRQAKELLEIEKSIAVLPFENWNSDEEYAHMGDAIANEINTQLAKIKEFHIISYTSSSKYKGSDKSAIPVIGKELGANFIIEGTIERQKENVSIHVQVIKSESDDHLFAEEFKGKWEDIFKIRAEIAIKIAGELQAMLSPAEVEQIEKIPTTNLTAYDYYLKGMDFYVDYLLDNNNQSALEKAIVLFQTALEIDATFARAYAGLAIAHYSRYSFPNLSGGGFSDDYFNEEFLDSVLVLANMALSFDDQIDEAYYVKGLYYSESGNLTEALDNYEKALIINPNNVMVLVSAGILYGQSYDYVKALSSLHKAASIDHSSTLSIRLMYLLNAYFEIGFNDKAIYYAQETSKLTGESIIYNIFLWLSEFSLVNNESAFKYAKAAYELDSTNSEAILYLGTANLFTKRYQEAYKYYSKYYELVKESGGLDVNDMHRMGYALWKIGKKDEARYYFNELIRGCKKSITLKNTYSRQGAHFDLAGVYAFLGDKEMAYRHLEEFVKTDYQILYIIMMLKQQDPLFNSIREEERFQQLLHTMEAKYQAEHERVRKWLEEQGML